MAGRGEVVVRIVGDARGLSGALGQAEGRMAGFQARLQAVGRGMQSAGRTMTRSFTLPIVAGLGLAAKAAAEEEQEMAVLANTLRKTTGATDDHIASVEKWITATQNATGVSDGELRPALGNLLIAGRSVEQAQGDMAVALDIAAAKGISLETVTKAMAKASMGNVGALAKLNIETKDAAGNTLTYDQILQNASATMGGAAAAAADTAAGRMAILKAKFADLVEQIGAILIPVIERLVGMLSGAAEWFTNLSPQLQQIGVIILAVVAAAGPLLSVLGTLLTVLGALSAPVLLVVAAVAALAAGLIYAYTHSEEFRDTVNEAITQVRAIAEQVFADLTRFVEDNRGKFAEWGTRIERIMITAGEIMAMVLNAARVLWETFGSTVLTFVTEKFDAILRIIDGVMQTIQGVIDVVLGVITGDWSRAWDGIQGIVDGVLNIIQGIVESVLANLKAIVSAALSIIGINFDQVWNTVLAIVEAAINGVKNVVVSGIQFVVNIFLTMAELIIGAADRAFGWVPGLGDKIDKLAGGLEGFKERANAALQAVIDRDIRITADTEAAIREIDRLIVRINQIPFAVVGGSSLARELKAVPVGGKTPAARTSTAGAAMPPVNVFVSLDGEQMRAWVRAEVGGDPVQTTALVRAGHG